MYCQVAGSCSNIQYLLGLYSLYLADGFFAPALVYTHRQKMVQKIIFTGYVIKHIGNLIFLA